MESERAFLLEYARYHHLCRPLDNGKDDIWEDLHAFCETVAKNIDESEAQAYDHNNPTDLVEEKLSIDADAAHLLISIIRPNDGFSLDCPEHDHINSAKRLRLESPILRTDPGLDICNVFNRAESLDPIEAGDHQSLSVDDEADCGLDWPNQCLKLPEAMAKKSSNEKLEIDRAAMNWMQSVLTGYDTNKEDVLEVFHEDLTDPGSKVRNCLTPPLSPSRSKNSKEALSSSSPIGKLAMSSDNADSSEDLNVSWDEMIEEQNQPTPVTNFSPAKDLHLSPTCHLESLPDWKNTMDLKLEVPLSPHVHSTGSKSKSSNDFTTLINPLMYCNSENVDDSQEEFNKFVEAVIDWEGQKANEAVKNETLQEADATMRLAVPILDFSIPTPPWTKELASVKSEAEIQELTSLIARLRCSHLPLDYLEKQLNWVPFPLRASNIVKEEEMIQTDENSIDAFIGIDQFSGVPPDAGHYLFKRPGLSLLKSRSDESDMEENENQTQVKLDHLVKKRKAEIEYPIDSEALPTIQGFQSKKLRTQNERTSTFPSEKYGGGICDPIPVSKSSMPSLFSISEELSNFLFTQTGQSRYLNRAISYRNETASNVVYWMSGANGPGPDDTSLSNHTINTMIEDMPDPPSPMSVEPEDTTFDSLIEALTPTSVIISSSIMSRYRSLFKQLSTKLTSLDMIVRDFSGSVLNNARDNFEHQAQHPSIYKPSQSQVSEADIIISPGAGIILTTLQQIKQKSLPGQKELPVIRSRVSDVCRRYENLFVLVQASISIPTAQAKRGLAPNGELQSSASSTTPAVVSHNLSDDDKEALSSFENFASNLAEISTIRMSLVEGSEKSLFRSIVALMKDYSNIEAVMVGESLLLAQDETWSELRMRQLGLNAFAAQVLLLQLEVDREASRHKHDEQSNGKEKDLVEIFKAMTSLERESRFAALLGGTRVLDSVRTLIEGDTRRQKG